ncbi:MAG: acyltransferase family protein [Chitinophagaceae bacterium]
MPDSINSKNNNSKIYFPALTGLRAVAAFIVFLHHYPIQKKWVGSWGYSFFQELYIGVSIFFVLSGFLIYTRYADSIQFNKQWMFTYLKNRFARIYPIYFLLTIITFIYYWNSGNIYVIFNHEKWWTFIANITFIRGYFKDLLLTGVAQGWTLTVEETFYFTAPFLFIFIKKTNTFIVLLSLYLLGFLLYILLNNDSFYGLFADISFVGYGTFFGRCFDFIVGIQLAIMYQKNTLKVNKNNYFTFIGITFICLVITCLIAVKGNEDFSFYGTKGLLINNFLLPPAIGILLWGLITEKTIITSILSSKIFDVLGKSSYCFYMLHLGILSELLFSYVTHNYLFNFPIILLLSIGMYYFVEKPIELWIKKRF